MKIYANFLAKFIITISIVMAASTSTVAMKQVATLKDQIMSSVADQIIAGKITTENLRTSVPLELYEGIVKIVILNTVKSTNNLDAAIEKIKKLSSEDINNDEKFSGTLINVLNSRFKADYNTPALKLLHPDWDEAQIKKDVPSSNFGQSIYRIFAASRLNTTGTFNWLKHNKIDWKEIACTQAFIDERMENILTGLVDAGVNPDSYDFWGYTPLMFAILSGSYANAALLIKLGANVNARDKQGSSVLDTVESAGILSYEQKAKFRQLLIEKGATQQNKNLCCPSMLPLD